MRTSCAPGARSSARRLNPGHVAGRNLVRDAFLDPVQAGLHVDLPGGLRLLVHSAEPGTPDGDKLALIR